ncbi:TPA: RHS repeat-associated core domain-containing protein [Pseudomonas putida]|uniref:RHS repeat-associated core domain-containing protein n=1 Tax=Pseudomonas putida TaxID=303 RepID=UPI00330075BF|nr:RHS repeat-associated core domain-containing protein [Pseudomonas putida]
MSKHLFDDLRLSPELSVMGQQDSLPQARTCRCYSAYGYEALVARQSLIGFNGNQRDVVSGCDLLGNGVRAYSPVLMRFCSPDTLSPFSAGGINAYIYCGGDPINFVDSDGHTKNPPLPSPWTYPRRGEITRPQRPRKQTATQAPAGSGFSREELDGYYQRAQAYVEATPSSKGRKYGTQHIAAALVISESTGGRFQSVRSYIDFVAPTLAEGGKHSMNQSLSKAVRNIRKFEAEKGQAASQV